MRLKNLEQDMPRLKESGFEKRGEILHVEDRSGMR